MKIERKYMAHYLNAAFGSGDASYTRLKLLGCRVKRALRLVGHVLAFNFHVV